MNPKYNADNQNRKISPNIIVVKKKVKFDESLESSIYDKFDEDNVGSVGDPNAFKSRYLTQDD
jgi:hypothetical protein